MMPYGSLSELGEVSVSQLNGRIMIPRSSECGNNVTLNLRKDSEACLLLHHSNLPIITSKLCWAVTAENVAIAG
jgi:hypothetical protein